MISRISAELFAENSAVSAGTRSGSFGITLALWMFGADGRNSAQNKVDRLLAWFFDNLCNSWPDKGVNPFLCEPGCTRADDQDYSLEPARNHAPALRPDDADSIVR